MYELDNLQNQLEKAQVSSNRFQTEREDFEIDSQRQREKNDKLQVSTYIHTYRQTDRQISHQSIKRRKKKKEEEEEAVRNCLLATTNVDIVRTYEYKGEKEESMVQSLDSVYRQ